ncbi:lysine histidine transporter 1-like [Salvia splendens]|uniref:lysine histidine transporter 1-like n=1 Tax=Salvia splendens TaxID=180675 RepID=UPI001C264631|nr:lysine histidine transporter 1-like [Salvia splendens]
MWKGAIVAYVIVALCYFPVALVGYWTFGTTVEDNILITLQRPEWLVATANMFVAVHLIGGYQFYAMPVYDMTDTVLVKKLKFKPTWYLRFITGNTYVALTMFIAIAFPFFGALVRFFGGFTFAPNTYFLPCIIWLAIYKPKRFSLSWLVNWASSHVHQLVMPSVPVPKKVDGLKLEGNVLKQSSVFVALLLIFPSFRPKPAVTAQNTLESEPDQENRYANSSSAKAVLV